MIEKDYILRLLNQFFEDLNIFFNRKDKKDTEKDIVFFYSTYVGDYLFFHTAEIEDILKSFDKYNSNERLYRMQMLAELYLQEAQMEITQSDKKELWRRSLAIWEYINTKSDTYSMERMKKIEFIKSNRLGYVIK